MMAHILPRANRYVALLPFFARLHPGLTLGRPRIFRDLDRGEKGVLFINALTFF